MSMTKQTYSAPTLTYYGKLAELTQAGSRLFQADLNGDGNLDGLYDTDGDPTKVEVLVLGGTPPTEINLTYIGVSSSGPVYDLPDGRRLFTDTFLDPDPNTIEEAYLES